MQCMTREHTVAFSITRISSRVQRPSFTNISLSVNNGRVFHRPKTTMSMSLHGKKRPVFTLPNTDTCKTTQWPLPQVYHSNDHCQSTVKLVFKPKFIIIIIIKMYWIKWCCHRKQMLTNTTMWQDQYDYNILQVAIILPKKSNNKANRSCISIHVKNFGQRPGIWSIL